MTVAERLGRVQSSRVLEVIEADAAAVDGLVAACAATGLIVRELEGSRMRSIDGAMDQFSAAFEFPGYFGRNWAALDETLADMDWLLPATGIVAVIRDGSEVLVDEGQEALEALVSVLDNALRDYAEPVEQGEPWDRPAVPFHVVMQMPRPDAEDVMQRWSAAGAQMQTLRV